MGVHWPPSPQVEDEELSLRHEFAPEIQKTSRGDVDEARSRGTVDQFPIILDVKADTATDMGYNSSTDNEGDSVRTQSSDESFGPPTPTFPKDASQSAQTRPSRPKPQTHPSFRVGQTSSHRDTSQENGREIRGRPSIPRIHTDIDLEAQAMATGQRRAPSPYSYTKPDTAPQPGKDKQSSSNTFLSPEHYTSSQPSNPLGLSKRHSSAQPSPRPRSKSRTDAIGYGDTRSRSRHHSRRRSARPLSPDTPTSGNDGSSNGRPAHRRSSSYAFLGSDLRQPMGKPVDAEDSSRNIRSQKPLPAGDREPAVYQEVGTLEKRPDPTTNHSKRQSRDSFYTSSADEDRASQGFVGRYVAEDQKPRLPSRVRKDRPQLDLSGHRYTYDGHIAINGDNNINKQGSAPSPWRSPPCTPPSTHQGERRAADYFGKNAHTAIPVLESLRQGLSSRPEAQSGATRAVNGAGPGVPLPKGVAQPPPPPARNVSASAEVYPRGDPAWPNNARRSGDSSPLTASRESLVRFGRDQESLQARPSWGQSVGHTTGGNKTGTSLPYPPPPTPPPPQSATADFFGPKTSSHSSIPPSRPLGNHRAFSHSAADGFPNQHVSSVRSAPLHNGPYPAPSITPTSKKPGLQRPPASLEKVPRPASLAELPPCPRAVPVAGYFDWYTVVGMPQLDICPACMSVLAASPFHEMFVPSNWAVEGQRILCDFSRPWIRNAWAQIIKQRRSSLEMIYQVIRNSETTKPCPGKGSDIRAWYRLPDPATGANVPNFDACSECVRSIEIIFPQLRGIFKRPKSLVQERTCDLNTQSARFEGYLRLLDAAALKYDVERLKEPDIQPFADHARKTARVRECSRDDMVLDQLWHFIPALPQFTICEECFEQVVWPVADQPVARSVNRSLQLVPCARRHSGLSCQLYSERMRRVFLEAVSHGDFEYLKQAALRRHNMERLLQDKHKALISDVSKGIDRTAELQTNIDEWRKWE